MKLHSVGYNLHTHTHTHVKTDMPNLADAYWQLFVANVRKSTETYLSFRAFVLLIYLNVFRVILNSSLINAAACAALSNRPITEFEFNLTTRTNETDRESKKNQSNNRHLPSKYIRAKMELADCTQQRLNAVGPVQ